VSETAVRVSGVGKRYQLGARRERYASLRESLTRAAAGWLQTLSARRTADNGRRGEGASFWALNDVSFSIEVGEVVGIIGGNGAGKSTLLKILSRITWPTTGRAEVRGRVGSLLEVGTGFHPELTGRENILLNGAILGMGRAEIERNFDAIVAFAEVERFIDTPVKHYSSGMYLRLGFAVAAHLEPEILLVDEVLAVGDAAFQKKCLGRMGDAARAGRTVIFVSHNMTAVLGLCSRAIWLHQGRVLQDGPPAAVVAAYLQSAAANRSEQTWAEYATAPGNDKVRLRRVAVLPSLDHPLPITTGTPLQLEFEYVNLHHGALLNLSLHVYNKVGIMVFNAVPVLEPVWQGRPMPRGVFRDICFIPGNLLNDGVHRVELLVVQNGTDVILRIDDVLVFDVHDTPENRSGWFGDWAGAVRPLFPWATELLELHGQDVPDQPDRN
jgi:lipopolysaccharide transport system ATP-binding protein